MCNTQLAGKQIINLQKAALDHPAELQILGIKRDGKSILNPNRSEEIQHDDQLLVLTEDLQNFINFEKSLLA